MNNQQWLVFIICVIFYMVACVAVALRLVWLWMVDARTLWQRFRSCPIPPRSPQSPSLADATQSCLARLGIEHDS